ncbi:MAG TPA: hypothetical protein VK694_01805 [Verrucomicrobiae bacterium]|nr:hypothetical protein [Verrucomicrobiae bacterium]
MKLKALFLSAGIFLSILAFSPARASALTLPPNQEKSFWIGDCAVKYTHGWYANAYSVYQDVYDSCGSKTFTRVTSSTSSSTNCGKDLHVTNTCKIDSIQNKYTAFAPGVSLVKSELKICTNNNHVCQNYTFTP